MKSTVANMIDEDLRDGTITRESVYPIHNTDSDECWTLRKEDAERLRDMCAEFIGG